MPLHGCGGRASRASRSASIHDLGIAKVDSDLTIDGSVGSTWARLHGPAFAILDPKIKAIRSRGRQPIRGQLLVALGGGAHVAAIAARLSRALAVGVPDMKVRVATGFATGVGGPRSISATGSTRRTVSPPSCRGPRWPSSPAA